MKKIYFFKLFAIIFMAQIFTSSNLFSQACYNPYVEYIVSTVSMSSINMFNRELTGDTMTTIGGQPFLIYSRVHSSPANDKAAQYIYEKFKSFGLETKYQVYSERGKNVIAVKKGIKYPDKYYLIGAHYDNMISWSSIPDTTFGADDNASGTCGVLEAARVLAPYNLDYTIVFVAFDEEELWMLGSKAYADSVYNIHDSLLGMINLDMIAYDGNNTNTVQIFTDTNSSHFCDILYSSCLLYQPGLTPIINLNPNAASDHASFWEKGYKASFFFENDFNPYYHTVGDNYEHLSKPYMSSIIKAAIASLVVLGKDFIINFYHTPLASTYDTTSREVTTVIKANTKIAGGSNQPRLYYKTQYSQFTYTNASYISSDTFKFTIPGFSVGTTVYYYISAQDSASTIVGSTPPGCRGMSPPGNVPPNDFYLYHVLNNFTMCSSGPKALLPHEISYDSIFIGDSKLINDMDVLVNINHPNDTDLYIFVKHNNTGQTTMSIRNGGSGDNYINTIFDDEAELSIKDGTPPFTGHFRPEVALSRYDNTSTDGYWILKIYNNSDSDTAQLVSWCINFSTYNPIGIANNQVPLKFSLSQNYPNPFNPSTKINYSLAKAGFVKLAVYDILGREITVLANGEQKAGKYEVSWNAENLPSGVYFYRLSHPDFTESKKMILLR